MSVLLTINTVETSPNGILAQEVAWPEEEEYPSVGDYVWAPGFGWKQVVTRWYHPSLSPHIRLGLGDTYYPAGLLIDMGWEPLPSEWQS